MESLKFGVDIAETYDKYNVAGKWKQICQAQMRALCGDAREHFKEKMNAIRTWGGDQGAAAMKAKHMKLVQEVARAYLGKSALRLQKDAMRQGLHYSGHDHWRAIHRLYSMNDDLAFLAPRAAKFCEEEMAETVVPATLKHLAEDKYIKNDGRDCTFRSKVLEVVEKSCRHVEADLKLSRKNRERNDGGSKRDHGNKKGNNKGGKEGKKKTNPCHLEGHNHERKDCPKIRHSKN